MSLHVYLRKRDIPNSLRYVACNDSYFAATSLTHNALTNKILSTVDEARYASAGTFYSRDNRLLPKEYLSTGTKTLLNILQHPRHCFDVCECGNNALNMLPSFTTGNIYWRIPVTLYTGPAKCDIICNRRRFTDFYEFLSYAINEGSE